MTPDLTTLAADLKEKAIAATPGPWVFIPAGNRPEIYNADGRVLVARIESLRFVGDATYIAAASPSTILSILAERDRDKTRIAALEGTMASINRCLSPGNRTFDEMIRDCGYACYMARANLKDGT